MIRVQCNTFQSYYDYLFSNQGEIKKFLESFNINYTRFFRDWEVYETFQKIFIKSLNTKCEKFFSNIQPNESQKAQFRTRENYIKKLKKKKLTSNLRKVENGIISKLKQLSLYHKIQRGRNTRNRINIWSCPCASGEEPYTLAMILNNLSQEIPNFPMYNIVASDIDNNIIIDALTGLYSENAMSEITAYYKNKYFSSIRRNFGFNYLISESLKDNMEFIKEDVTKGHKKSIKYDIIFCRYLLIYFNRENRNKFLKTLHNQLEYGGILIIGKTETLFEVNEMFNLIDSDNHIYIKKR
jgi:chemotaxis methyl-accepting protein methylase